MSSDPSTAAALADIARLDQAAEVHVLRHNGMAVTWRRFGSGPPLVLLHGGHGSWLHWVRNIEALAREHTLLVPDMPGYGESDDVSDDPHSPERLGALVDALIGTLDQLVPHELPHKTRIDLTAFSFGAMAAAELMVRRGAVARIALIGPGGHGTGRRQAMPMIDWRVDDVQAMRSALRHNLSALMLHDPAAIDALALEVHERSCLATRFRSRTISLAGGLKETLSGFTGPLLLLWGEHDVTADPKRAGPHLADGRPERRWMVAPGAGHWAQFESFEMVNAVLLEWFKNDSRDSVG